MSHKKGSLRIDRRHPIGADSLGICPHQKRLGGGRGLYFWSCMMMLCKQGNAIVAGVAGAIVQFSRDWRGAIPVRQQEKDVYNDE